MHNFTLPVQIVVDNPDQAWVLYDAGPREVKCPLIFLPAVCGTADCFFKQVLTLSAQGYRVIAVLKNTTVENIIC